jgi:hypothetical protein
MPIKKRTKKVKEPIVGNPPRKPQTKAQIEAQYAREDEQMAKNKMKRGGASKKKKY